MDCGEGDLQIAGISRQSTSITPRRHRRQESMEEVGGSNQWLKPTL